MEDDTIVMEPLAEYEFPGWIRIPLIVAIHTAATLLVLAGCAGLAILFMAFG